MIDDIPVRGRKLIRLSSTIILYECMLPVRGRKLLNFTLDISPSCITTYPRKGARTLSPSGCNVSVLYDPRKGAKTHRCTGNTSHASCDPRKGTKNSASTPHQKMRSFSFAILNFLFSVGCPSMNGTIAAAVIFSLLRLLHSDKMCYNKANSKHLLQNQQICFPFIVQFFHNP